MNAGPLCLFPRQRFIFHAQQFHRFGHVVAGRYINGYPAGIRIHMMGLPAPGCDEMIAERFWKEQIDEMIAVEMPDFRPFIQKFNPAETVGLHGYARP